MNQPRRYKNILVVLLMLSVVMMVSLLGSETQEHVQLQEQRQTLVSRRSNIKYGLRAHRAQRKMGDTQRKRIYHEEKITKLLGELRTVKKEIKQVDFKLTAFSLKLIVSAVGISVSLISLFLNTGEKEGTTRLDEYTTK